MDPPLVADYVNICMQWLQSWHPAVDDLMIEPLVNSSHALSLSLAFSVCSSVSVHISLFYYSRLKVDPNFFCFPLNFSYDAFCVIGKV